MHSAREVQQAKENGRELFKYGDAPSSTVEEKDRDLLETSWHTTLMTGQ